MNLLAGLRMGIYQGKQSHRKTTSSQSIKFQHSWSLPPPPPFPTPNTNRMTYNNLLYLTTYHHSSMYVLKLEALKDSIDLYDKDFGLRMDGATVNVYQECMNNFRNLPTISEKLFSKMSIESIFSIFVTIFDFSSQIF